MGYPERLLGFEVVDALTYLKSDAKFPPSDYLALNKHGEKLADLIAERVLARIREGKHDV